MRLFNILYVGILGLMSVANRSSMAVKLPWLEALPTIQRIKESVWSVGITFTLVKSSH
jgi:hypothetical protein